MENDIVMIRGNYTTQNKITFGTWVDKTLDLALTRKNIMLRFKSKWT
jgi:hypothetical protein